MVEGSRLGVEEKTELKYGNEEKQEFVGQSRLERKKIKGLTLRAEKKTELK
jgi:hypothetical protein